MAYLTTEIEKTAFQTIFVIVGALLFIAVVWVLAAFLPKLLGIVLALLGLYLIFGLHNVYGRYQSAAFAHSGIFMGLLFLVLGIVIILVL